VEKHLLGITLPYQNLREAYSARISASTSIPGLLQLLEHEVIPSLLVRQFAFLQVLNGEVGTLLMKDAEAGQLPRAEDIDDLLKLAGKPHPTLPSNGESPYSWIHLVLPLRASGNLTGLWLFGHRDPDDIYPHARCSSCNRSRTRPRSR